MSDLVGDIKQDLETVGNGGRALDAVDAIMRLHCDGGGWCTDCDRRFPCSTVRAVASALGVREDPEVDHG